MQISQIISKNLRSDHLFSTTHFTRSKRISWQYVSPKFLSRNYDLRAKETDKNNFSDGGSFFLKSQCSTAASRNTAVQSAEKGNDKKGD